MRQILHKLSAATRAKDWRLSFVPFVMGCVYMWLWWFDIEVTPHTLWLTFLSLVTTVGFASLGYFINEFFDKASDAKAGKINKLAYLPATTQVAVFAGTLALTFLPWLWLPATTVSWVLIAIQIGLFLIYSLPFPRLKESTYLSVIADASYAYAVPLVLSFYTFSLIAQIPGFSFWFYVFMAAAFAIGLRNIIIHQITDVFKDSRSGMQTLPMKVGVDATKTIVATVALYEVFLMVGASVLISIAQPTFLLWLIPYIIVAALSVRVILSKSYDPQEDILLINRVYLYLFPVLMLLLAAWQHPAWLLLLPLHILLFVPLFLLVKAKEIVKVSYYGTITFIAVDARNAVSLAVNLPVYYVFRIVGVDLKAEQKSAWQYLKNKLGAK